MSERIFQIGICGTFDVQNYGDLLFPILAEAELSKRLGAVRLHRYSYHARTAPAWPYEVTSVDQLPGSVEALDCMLIGGGFIVRFDKEVAPHYAPPSSHIHHPTGYWLTPALTALQHGVPVAWNAPGMHCNDVPSWAQPLLRLALEHSAYIRVRDEPSRVTLAAFGPAERILVLPDTGFGVSRLFDLDQPSAAFSALRKRVGLDAPYIVVQATFGLDSFLALVRGRPELFSSYRFLILPIGPVLNDRESNVGHLPGMVHLPFWPEPTLLAEILGHAQAVVGHSYHLAITALSSGVPVFCSANLEIGKYTALADFENIHPIVSNREIDPTWFLSRLGRRAPDPLALKTLDLLDRHWDDIADITRRSDKKSGAAFDRFWQSLPNTLESAATEVATVRSELLACEDKARERADPSAQFASELALLRDNLAVLHTSMTALWEQHEASERIARLAENELKASLAAARTQSADQERLFGEKLLALEAILYAALPGGGEETQDYGERVVHLEDTLRRTRAEADEQLARLAQLAAECAAARAEVAALRTSHSFRLTAPLRYARRALTQLLVKNKA